jgi:hypothetical protein
VGELLLATRFLGETPSHFYRCGDVEAPAQPFLEGLHDEGVVGVESAVRMRVLELGRRVEIESRETVIFIHRKFIIVGYSL